MIPRAILGMPYSALYVGSKDWWFTNVAIPELRDRIETKLADDLINGTPPGSEHFRVSGFDAIVSGGVIKVPGIDG